MLSGDRKTDEPSSNVQAFPEYFEALLKAPPFDATPRRAGLLRYLVEKSLAGEAGSLNEYAIALEVFAKPESFDQRIDSSVRSEISRLRKMVVGYYEGPGAKDAWRIVFPSRGYVPQVQPAHLPMTVSALPDARVSSELVAARTWRVIAIGGGAVAVTIAGLAAWQHREPRNAPSAVAETLAVRPAAHVPSPEVQALYLKGQYYWEHRTEGNLRQAVDAYTQAIVADSNYAEAYAGLAECYDLMPEYSSAPQGDAFKRAIAAANKALTLDPDNSVAHRALGFGLFWSQRDVARAFQELQEAIRLTPNDADAHHWYATALSSIQRNAEAEKEIDRAQQLAPASRSILADQAWIRHSAGDPEATVKLQELEAAEPDFSSPPRFLARIDLNTGNYPGYLDQISRVASLSDNPQDKRLVAVAKKGWSSGGELGMLHAMKSLQEDAFVKGETDGYDLAHICALLGEKQEALRYLQVAFAARDMFVLDALLQDWAPPLNGYPPFEEFRRQIRMRFAIT